MSGLDLLLHGVSEGSECVRGDRGGALEAEEESGVSVLAGRGRDSMDTCPGDRWPGVCSTGTQGSEAHGSGVEDSGNPVSLKGMQGASVLFQLLRNPDLPAGVELEKMTWGISSGANYTTLLQVSPGAHDPEWVNFQDKFQKRVHVLNITTLRMNNLTPEDTGLYRARGFYSRGRQYDQDFHLTVYEPLPLPQIWAKDRFITPGWCNVTVKCDTMGTREDLTLSWERKRLPRELEQRVAPGPAPNPWTLALSLPLSQPSASLTCVLSNQEDQRTVTLDLGDICGHADPQGQADASQLPSVLGTVVVLLLILGAGLFLWRTRVKKSLEPGRGSQEEHRDPDSGIYYAELSQQGSGDSRDKGRGAAHLEGNKPLTTVYSEVRRAGVALMRI
ncbi:SLAM family member 9-like isoform X3 [Canis lupus baileyi]|uniref:SLAM family member 9-like isoform X3 n=1 Tax=Canis lupus baileyi TaxID=143281 RepID=UPI003B96A49D